MQLSDMHLTEEKMMEEKYEMLIPEIGVDLNERKPAIVGAPLKIQRLCWEADYLQQAVKHWHRRVGYLPDHQETMVREYAGDVPERLPRADE